LLFGVIWLIAEQFNPVADPVRVMSLQVSDVASIASENMSVYFTVFDEVIDCCPDARLIVDCGFIASKIHVDAV
jgi:hypothetical protein